MMIHKVVSWANTVKSDSGYQHSVALYGYQHSVALYGYQHSVALYYLHLHDGNKQIWGKDWLYLTGTGNVDPGAQA